MSNRTVTTAERGKFKQEIHSALYRSQELKELLIGDISEMSQSTIQSEFKKHVKSHLFVDDTIEETDSFIFYDVMFPSIKPNVKNCNIIMYIICHRDILENCYIDGYFGNRADIISQMVENILLNDKETKNSFGIGELSLDSIDIYNARRFYGCALSFSTPTFR